MRSHLIFTQVVGYFTQSADIAQVSLSARVTLRKFSGSVARIL